ncbi:MerR family transcriptional regulator [Actinospica robiniae]|uniref:MerR family transcriptional regulator n=1 Tax=Actinospica robiniae TaxID=304901 RepID=UPI001FE0B4C8|nr:MerR family transcriptional regulator [Actinospica robiniae]
MRISELAERSGVPATTLRFYETAGLVPAERSAAGYRLYGRESLERLEFIGAAKHLGLPLEEIAETLDVWERGACAEVKADLRPRLARSLAEAEQRRAEVDRFISELRRASAHLDALPERSERCDTACGFPADRTALAVSGLAAEDAPEAPVACALNRAELEERTAR